MGLDVARLWVDEEVVGDGVLDIEEALFVGTLHAGLDGDVAQFLVIEVDVGCAAAIGSDEAEHEGEVGLESLVLNDILDELAVLGVAIVLATIAAAGGACGELDFVTCFALLFACGYVVDGASLECLFLSVLLAHVRVGVVFLRSLEEVAGVA